MSKITTPINTEEKNLLVNVITRAYNEIIINIDNEIIEPSKYRDVYDTLYKADVGDTVIIVLNTVGGYLATQNQIINNLLDTKAKTKAIIHEASSVGSAIALACDEIEVKKFGYMFIHNAFAGAIGKMNEIEIRIEHLKEWIHTAFTELYQGFLTDIELKQVFEGKDFYFNKKEIEKRLLNWTPMRKRALT